MTNSKTLAAVLLVSAGLAAGAAPAVARTQSQPSTDGAARAGSNAGSSSLTPTRAPKAAKPQRSKAAASHRLPANATGMGSQAANATGPTANSH